jgi:hypothetical protein
MEDPAKVRALVSQHVDYDKIEVPEACPYGSRLATDPQTGVLPAKVSERMKKEMEVRSSRRTRNLVTQMVR